MQPHIRKADPCLMVIFEATGDLTRRKLMPPRRQPAGRLAVAHFSGFPPA